MKLFKKMKIKYKNNLILKISRLKKENKKIRNRLTDEVLKHQDYIDELNLRQAEIRKLNLMIERLKNERNNTKKK